MTKIAIVGPVYPYRAGIAHCTTRLAEELSKHYEVAILSFKRQYPKKFYPGGSDKDESLRGHAPESARFILDILNPVSWLRGAAIVRRVDVVIFVWWIWVWAVPYRMIRSLLPRRVTVIFQCHNVSDKEPSRWKSLLTNRTLRSADHLIVHAASDEKELQRRRVIPTDAAPASRRQSWRRPAATRLFLPVHEMGQLVPARGVARMWLDIDQRYVALFFGHVRPFKGLDVALRAWKEVKSDVLLLVAGEFWDDIEKYRGLVNELGISNRVRFEPRFIPDAEIGDYFAAADVVLVPYRAEAQSGVVMTAFHFARPVIATRVGGIPEVVIDGDNGLLIDPDDPSLLAETVDRFFNNWNREAMEEAVRRSAKRFSWKEYAQRVGALIEEAVQ